MKDITQPTRGRGILIKCLLGGLALGVGVAAILVLLPAASSGDWYDWTDSAIFLGLPVIALGTLGESCLVAS
jgi:hypothetical protein